MAALVAVPWPHDLELRIVGGAGTVVELNSHARNDSWILKVATMSAVAYGVSAAVNDVLLISVSWTSGGLARGLWALAATIIFLPLCVRNVWYAAHGARPRAGIWSLAVQAVVIVGALPLVGEHWVRTLWALCVSSAISLRLPWSRLVIAVVVVGSFPLALVTHQIVAEAWWDAAQVPGRTLVLMILIWLAAGIRHLHAARQVLADDAVARERSRIDGELQRTLGVELDEIVRRGESAVGLARAGDPATTQELRDLVDGCRLTLAEARRMIRGYRQTSLQAELDTAASLLAAGGIGARVLPFHDRLDPAVELSARAALRSTVARLLSEGTTSRCVLSVSRDGSLRLDVHVETPYGGAVRAGAG